MLLFFLIFLFQTLEQDFLNDLKGNDQNKILQALDYFSYHPKENVLQDIYALLNHDEYQIRANAIWCLSNFKDKVEIEKISNYLNDESPYVKAYTILALIKLKNKDFYEKTKELTDDNSSIVKISSKAYLTFIEKENYKEEIKNYVLSRNMDEVYISSISLALFGDTESINLLISILSHSMDEYRNASAISLKEAPYNKELLKALFDSFNKETYAYVNTSFSKTIAYQGIKDIPYTTELLLGSKKKVLLINELKKYEGSSQIIDEISKKLEKINVKDAVDILEVFEGENTLKILRKIAENKKFSSEGRASAIKVLGKKNDLESINFLRKMLKESDPYLKASSSYALALLKDEKSKDIILALLNDENSRVRQAALFYVREMNLKEAIEKVEKLLDDKDNMVKQMAGKVLKKLKEN